MHAVSRKLNHGSIKVLKIINRMNKKLKIALIALLIIALGVLFVWKFVNKPTTDYHDAQPEMSFNFSALMKKIETDTAGLKNKLIAIEGPITKITSDSASCRLEIGYDSIMSSVTCDIDARYIKEMNGISEGKPIHIKGIVSEVTVDPESSFGNTVALIYCTLHKK